MPVYRVRPGSIIKKDGTTYEPDDEITLTDEEAKALGSSVDAMNQTVAEETGYGLDQE